QSEFEAVAQLPDARKPARRDNLAKGRIRDIGARRAGEMRRVGQVQDLEPDLPGTAAEREVLVEDRVNVPVEGVAAVAVRARRIAERASARIGACGRIQAG